METNKLEYRRKISAEEAQESYILILKEALELFPKPRVAFDLVVGEETHSVQIDVVDRLPNGVKMRKILHRISTNKFRAAFPMRRSMMIVIEKNSDNTYKLSK